MSQNLEKAITAVKKNEFSFCKFISANDAGVTGAHQAGLYIPKNSIYLLFDEPGEKGENKEKYATIIWHDGLVSKCRFIYYGKGSRNEYRITRLGRQFKMGELVVIVKKNDTEYFGSVLSKYNEIQTFLDTFEIKRENTNNLIPISENLLFIENEEHIETEEINFKPKAHILVLLGEELIKSPVMAIYELIKNGYDADATFVKVEFQNIDDFDATKIIIEDDGTGMTDDVLKNVWFEPGTDFRKPVDLEGNRHIKRSAIFNRVPMGEKGVGRFAVHKLGNKIKFISRPSEVVVGKNGKPVLKPLGYEIEVEIDWRVFSQSKYLDDVVIEWKKKLLPETFKFKNSSGTIIEISSLKETWSRGMARQLKKNTISMLSPKNDLLPFKIDLNFNNNWLQNMPEIKQILDSSPYKVTAFVDEKYNMTFDYKFDLANNPALGSRFINKNSIDFNDKLKYERNIKGDLRAFYKDFLSEKGFESDFIDEFLKKFDSELEIPYGNLMLELNSFDLDSTSLRDYSSSPGLIKDLLKDHAGIKVFKGDLRVYDYGDPGNDWLGLDIRRVNNKSWMSNNQNIGYVYLDDATSSVLIEKTNREGFIENDAFQHFKLLITFILSEFKTERYTDREKWLLFNKKGSDSSFESQLLSFKNLINELVVADSEKKQQLIAEAEKIESRYDHDKNTLLIPAGVGMTASFAIHEIEKLVPRMENTVQQKKIDEEKLRDQVSELRDYTEGILSVLRKGGDDPVNIRVCVEKAVNNYSLRLKHRNITIENNFSLDELLVVCDKRLLITMIMNLVDNSIYWLDTVYKNDKGIYISISLTDAGTSVLFVDNGPGFKDKIEDIVKPFFTRKKNGIGIGMYLIDTVMMKYGRLNIIYDRNYLSFRGVPSKYDGAAVELIFKNKKL
jgi:signal transduction histidine kinase